MSATRPTPGRPRIIRAMILRRGNRKVASTDDLR